MNKVKAYQNKPGWLLRAYVAALKMQCSLENTVSLQEDVLVRAQLAVSAQRVHNLRYTIIEALREWCLDNDFILDVEGVEVGAVSLIDHLDKTARWLKQSGF